MIKWKCCGMRVGVFSAMLAGGAIVNSQEPAVAAPKPKPKPLQYESDAIRIEPASAEEPKRAAFDQGSVVAAAKYLDDGALAWAKERNCVACHTTGAYMADRPSLTKLLGKPNELVYQNFVQALSNKKPEPKEDRSIRYYATADRAVWRSLGLAEWDKHVTGKLSPETDRSLRDMLQQQSSHGGYHVVGEVEIPYITTDYNLSVQAARAVAAAPGWEKNLDDEATISQIVRLKSFLRDEPLRNDYDRVLRLQLAVSTPELVGTDEIQDRIQLLWKKQLADGGWSTRSMSSTMEWHVAVSDKVRTLIEGLPDANAPESDAYMTAFAIVLLRENGVPASDERIQRGIAWLKREQRQSGRWWMHSLYRGNYHFTTYIASMQALKALALCDSIAPHQ